MKKDFDQIPEGLDVIIGYSVQGEQPTISSRPSTPGDLWRKFAALRSIVLEGRDTNYEESLQL